MPALHAIPEPSRSFIDKVYRPYCKEWARYADSEDGDIDAAMEAIVSLCGNIILEAIKSTCEEHEYIGAGQNLMFKPFSPGFNGMRFHVAPSSREILVSM